MAYIYSFTLPFCWFIIIVSFIFIALSIVMTSIILAIIFLPFSGLLIIHLYAVSWIIFFILTGSPYALISSFSKNSPSSCSISRVVNESHLVIVNCPVSDSSTLSRAHHSVTWFYRTSFSIDNSFTYWAYSLITFSYCWP